MNGRTTWLAMCVGFLLGAPAAFCSPFDCPADLAGDGTVDALDLNYLLGAWGTPDPVVDFDADGEVGCFDLEFLLGWWGDCPTPAGDVNGDGVLDAGDTTFIQAYLGLACHADLNGDGAVDENDIDALLCLWGGPGPLGDLDGDGLVGVLDLNRVLGNIGAECQCDIDGDGLVAVSDVEILDKRIGK